MVGLGSAGVGIGISVTLLDRFTGNAMRISQAMTTMSKTINTQIAANLQAARRFGIGMALVGAFGVRAMGKAHGAFRDFDWQMTTVAAVTHKTKEELIGLDTIVKDLAQRSIFNPQEIASATTRLAKAGFELAQIEKAMEGIVFLGTATDTPVGGKTGVADMLAKILRSFDLPAEATSHVADVIAKAVNSAAMDMDDAFEALKFLGNTAHIMGLELEDAMAMVGVLANAGVPQGIAGRGLVNSLFKMAKSVGSMATKGDLKALATLGLSKSDIKDAKGNLLPMIDIIDRLMESVTGMGNTEVVSALSKWMRIRGGRAMMPLIQKYAESGAKTFRAFREMLTHDTSAEALRISNQRMASAEGVFRVMNDVWDTLKVTWGEAIDDVMTPFFLILSELMRKIIEFVKTPTGKWFAIAITGFLTLLTIAGVLTIAISTLGLMFTKTGVGISTMLKSMSWGMNAFAAATLRAVGATSALNGASWVGAGGVFAKKGVKGFQSGALLMGGAGGAAKAGGKGILGMLGRAFTGFVRFLGPLGMIVGILGMIVGWKNLLKGIVTVIGTVTNFIRLLFDAITGLFTGRVFEAFEKFGDAQRSLGTKGMFAEPVKVVAPPTGTAEEQRKKVYDAMGLRVKKAAAAYTEDRWSLANRREIDMAIQNNIIVDDEIVQREVKHYTNKEMANLLTN